MVADALRREILRRGPVRYDEVIELALYDPASGFYESGGRAGRSGDFLTSPEVGPLFGAVVASALDRWWGELGEPERFVVVDAGAGPGTLARAVLAAAPRCAPALRYVLVERSATQRALHGRGLPLEEPAFAFAGLVDPDDERAPSPPDGPIVVSLAELPRVASPVVVLANELLDNLPVRLAERTESGWAEVLVSLDGDGFGEVVVPLGDDEAASLGQLAPDALAGRRAPLAGAAVRWLRDALELAGQGGRVVVFDYAATTAELAHRPWTEWLRTYRRHGRGGHPLDALGEQDITCEVALDQLAVVRRPSSAVSQAEWLRTNGLGELLDEGRRTWRDRAHVGDLAAVRARSRIGEAEALCDPEGLGGFVVAEWTSVQPSGNRPRRGSSV